MIEPADLGRLRPSGRLFRPAVGLGSPGKERFRAEKPIEDFCQGENITLPKPIDAFSQQEMADFIEEKQISLPHLRQA